MHMQLKQQKSWASRGTQQMICYPFYSKTWSENLKLSQNLLKDPRSASHQNCLTPWDMLNPLQLKQRSWSRIWKQNESWDEDVPSGYKDQWLNWISDISNLTSIEITRPYFLTSISKKQLHIFRESSQLAYGAMAYLRGRSGAEVHNTFTMAKTRVEPLKTQTLPRLELLAALLGAQLSGYLTKTLQSQKPNAKSYTGVIPK